MKELFFALGGFTGGVVCTMLFASKLANSLAVELHRLGNRLQRPPAA